MSVSLSAEIPRSKLGKVPWVLTHGLADGIQFNVACWPLFLAWQPPPRAILTCQLASLEQLDKKAKRMPASVNAINTKVSVV